MENSAFFKGWSGLLVLYFSKLIFFGKDIHGRATLDRRLWSGRGTEAGTGVQI